VVTLVGRDGLTLFDRLAARRESDGAHDGQA
jgi:hypothetical protein